jgi:hypothetical protein
MIEMYGCRFSGRTLCGNSIRIHSLSKSPTVVVDGASRVPRFRSVMAFASAASASRLLPNVPTVLRCRSPLIASVTSIRTVYRVFPWRSVRLDGNAQRSPPSCVARVCPLCGRCGRNDPGRDGNSIPLIIPLIGTVSPDNSAIPGNIRQERVHTNRLSVMLPKQNVAGSIPVTRSMKNF